MNIQKYLTLLVLALSPVVSKADSVTLETHYVSHYLGDLFGIQVNDKPTWQSNLYANISLTDDTSITLGTWYSKPFDGSENDWGNEHDYYAYIHHNLEDWRITLGGTYYNLLEGEQIQLHGNIARDWGEWTTTLSAWHTIPFEELDFEGGTHLAVGLSRDFEITERLRINTLASVFYDSGVYGLDDGFFAQSKLRAIYELSDSWEFEVGVNAHLPLTTHDDRYTDASFVIGFRTTFDDWKFPRLFGR